jgi:hypothetical protein
VQRNREDAYDHDALNEVHEPLFGDPDVPFSAMGSRLVHVGGRSPDGEQLNAASAPRIQ